MRRDRHPQGRQGQVGAQMIGHRPADNPAAVQIHDGSEIEPAVTGLDIGDIGQANRGRSSGHEVAIERIRGDRQVMAAFAGPHTRRGRSMMALMPRGRMNRSIRPRLAPRPEPSMIRGLS